MLLIRTTFGASVAFIHLIQVEDLIFFTTQIILTNRNVHYVPLFSLPLTIYRAEVLCVHDSISIL